MSQTKPSITPELLTPRLGEYLVLEKRITQQQLNEALDYQREFRKANPGVHAPLVGEILVARGYVQKAVVDRSVTELIMNLKNALERSNSSLERRVKERTQELEFALSKIKVLNTHKSEFVSNISHELRTPLQHIIGYTYLFLDGTFGELADDQKAAMTSIKEATSRLESLIMDLISFTDIEQGDLLLTRSSCSPSDLCVAAVQTFTAAASNKGIRLTEQFHQEMPHVYADKERILWVLRQFISNSIKFTPEGGHILVKTEPQSEDYINFSVKDSGIGIPKEKFAEIFEPFLQLDGSSTRNAGGTGIGLTICKEIIEAHSSTIEIKSRVNHGSEFSFRLPVVTEDNRHD
jgi:signal transduction histidine kinase